MCPEPKVAEINSITTSILSLKDDLRDKLLADNVSADEMLAKLKKQ